MLCLFLKIFQRRRSENPQGFTLIELLIVVAIIAILAAIAVPNFLEAQARSKISRAKADMRTIATAVESYHVDENSYPRRSNTEQDHPAGTGSYTGFKDLTTPVSYLSEVPQDGFGLSESVPGVYRPACYAMGVGKASTRQANISGGNPDSYVLNSDGPDRLDQTNGQMADGQYPWPALDANDPSVQFTYMALQFSALTSIYDPTNGTVSKGEIFRFGGNKPDGRTYDYLFGGAAQ